MNQDFDALQRDMTFASLFKTRMKYMPSAEELIVAMNEDGIDISVVMGYGCLLYTSPRQRD